MKKKKHALSKQDGTNKF